MKNRGPSSQWPLRPVFDVERRQGAITVGNMLSGYPVPTVTRSTPIVFTTTPITFFVTFSEPVTGFATGDVVLTGTSGATTAIVTGSGASYTVSVSGMTSLVGSGTVIVSVPAGVCVSAATGLLNVASVQADTGMRWGARILDRFDRADSTNIGSTETGQPWTENVGDWAILTNQLRCSTGGTILAQVTIDAGQSDVSMLFQLNSLGVTVSQNAGILFRWQDANNHWSWVADRPNNDLYLQKVVGGVYTTVFQNTAAGIIANNNIMSLVLDGPNIQAIYNNVVQVEVSDSYLQSATRFGLASNGTGGQAANPRFNDFMMSWLD